LGLLSAWRRLAARAIAVPRLDKSEGTPLVIERGGAAPARPGPLLRVRILCLAGTADLWRLPSASAGMTFDEASAALERGVPY
jgi:hypothetical protein